MEHLEKMKQYIDRTRISSSIHMRYCLTLKDIQALYDCMGFDAFDSICMAFDYGLAKGYRAAIAGTRK